MIHVLIVEEVRAVGEVIATVLRGEGDIEVVGCVTNLADARPQLARCDVVVFNAGPLGNKTSPHLVRALRQLAPRVKLIVMGLARNQHTLLQHLQAGVSGYVLKDDPLGELLWSIRAAHQSEAQVAPPLAAKLMAYLAEVTGGDVERRFEFEPECGGPETLSRREREVLALIQRGLTNQEIAESLVIELGTVKNHVHNILRKLNVNSRRDAAHAGRLADVQWRPSGNFVPAAANR